MSAATLTSNHVNYLIWRYLQEAGLANAATQLARDWNRNPDSLPFAREIRSHTLVSIIQDGLWADEIQSGARKNAKRYNIGPDERRMISLQNGEGDERMDYRMASPGRHAREEQDEAATDGLAPPAKRARRVNGVDSRVNGYQGDTDAEAVSRVGTEPPSDIGSPMVEEVVLPPPPMVGSDKAIQIQSEKPYDLSANSRITTFDDARVRILHSLWSPSDTTALFVGGSNLMRTYHMPTSLEANADAIPNELDRAGFSTVTAACWGGEKHVFIATLTQFIDTELEVSVQTIGPTGECRIVETRSRDADPIFALKYNSLRELLLGVATNDEHGTIYIWDTGYGDEDSLDGEIQDFPLTVTTKEPIVDAVWMDGSTFVVAGQRILDVYEYDSSNRTVEFRWSIPTTTPWAAVRYDPVCNIIACKSLEDGQPSVLGIVSIDKQGESELRTQRLSNGQITEIQFQPVLNPASLFASSPRLLATAVLEGYVQIWNAKKPFEQLHRLSMMGPPALAMSFSPDGFLLAAASFGHVLIWNTEAGGKPKAIWAGAGTPGWPQDQDSGINGDGGKEVPPHTLSWDADSKRIAFGLSNKFAVIDFRQR